MSGYAATQRIEGVRPRRQRRMSESQASVEIAGTWSGDPVTIELVGRSFGEQMAERWARIRDAWGQTVFFLFDADSWR